MEAETSRSHEEVPDEADQEDSVMPMAQAILYPKVGEVEEEYVSKGVNDLGGVMSCIIVLGC